MTKTLTLPDVFSALADKTRLRIVNLLLSEPELCVCDLQSVLGIPQSAVSRHLALLRTSGIVEARRVDQWMHYSIPPTSPLNGALRTTLTQMCSADIELAADVMRVRTMLKLGHCAVRPAAKGRKIGAAPPRIKSLIRK